MPMLEFFIVWKFVSALITILVGAGLLVIIRKKTASYVKENRPAGFWVRAICLGTDLAVIDMLVSFLAYRGSFVAAGHIILLLTVSYFFFFWLFLSKIELHSFRNIIRFFIKRPDWNFGQQSRSK